MIIDTKTIIVTLWLVVIALYFGLKFVRAFALSIARENHDAVAAMEQEAQEKQRKQQRDADNAAQSAFAKVEPLLVAPAPSSAPVEGTGDVV